MPIPRVTVSVVAHRTSPALLDSLFASLSNEQLHRVYLLENSPTPLLQQWSKQHIKQIPNLIYRHIENRGYGAAHNVALREALKDDSDYHLVVNPDVRWSGSVLQPMTAYLDTHPDVAQIMPLTRYPDGRLQHTCRMLPSPIDLIARRLPSWLTRRRMHRYLLPPQAYKSIINGPYLLGCFMLFRCEALRQEGLFDERFFMYPEDIDITRRLHRHWRTLYWPEVEIIHDHAAASRHSLHMLCIHIKNMILYFNKYGWLHDAERRRFNKDLQCQVDMICNP